MDTKVEFSTDRYEKLQRRKPRGYTLWYFIMPDGIAFSQHGTYSEAKQAAAAHARRTYPGSVLRLQVCS